jgi:hypothetical protein
MSGDGSGLWRFRSGGDGDPDERGDRLSVVVEQFAPVPVRRRSMRSASQAVELAGRERDEVGVVMPALDEFSVGVVADVGRRATDDRAVEDAGGAATEESTQIRRSRSRSLFGLTLIRPNVERGRGFEQSSQGSRFGSGVEAAARWRSSAAILCWPPVV